MEASIDQYLGEVSRVKLVPEFLGEILVRASESGMDGNGQAALVSFKAFFRDFCKEAERWMLHAKIEERYSGGDNLSVATEGGRVFREFAEKMIVSLGYGGDKFSYVHIHDYLRAMITCVDALERIAPLDDAVENQQLELNPGV